MITSLTGTIIHKDERFITLDVGGVGYKVFVTPAMRSALRENESSRIWTHLAVREDALDLYGFAARDELEFFELLITVSGIGPKTALSVLSIATVPTIKKAVASDNPSYLTKVSGVGKKMSEKIVRELKDKLVLTDDEHGDALRDEGDSLEALKAIGYSEKEARDALKKVPDTVHDTSEKIKRAIKLLGSK